MKCKWPVNCGDIRIDEELGGVEAMAIARIVGTMRTQSVTLTGADVRYEAMKHIAALFRKRDPFELGLPRGIEQAHFDCARVRGVDRDIGAALYECQPEWLGTAGTDAAHQRPFARIDIMRSSRARLFKAQVAVHRGITFGRAVPADVCRHRALLKSSPQRAVAPE